VTPDELRRRIETGVIEEVVLAVTDLQGRLQGVRLGAHHFLDAVLDDDFGACGYLFAVDVDMRTGPGYGMDAEVEGFGDIRLRPDPNTIRPLPWSPSTACVLADAFRDGGASVRVAPRSVLKRQLDRLADRGLTALAGTELEFLAFSGSYREAADRRWTRLEPLTRHNVDYAVTGLGALEELARDIRRAMTALGLEVESARGECHPGQYEVVFRYADALTCCDQHVLYKAGAKEIAAQHGLALTFMPKFDAGEGNSCHVHLSLRDEMDRPAFADDRGGRSTVMDSFLAGQLACMADFTLLFAPTVNAYKRLRPGAFAPTRVAWGEDNRHCPIRVIGRGDSLRFEHRVPGGDANPYLAVAGMVAAGMHGLEAGLQLGAPVHGNPATGDSPRLPATLREARDRWLASPVARAAFGDDVVGHLAHAATVELDAFETAVTDWERERGFERL
jgi:glutamine synthetase